MLRGISAAACLTELDMVPEHTLNFYKKITEDRGDGSVGRESIKT